MVQLRGFMVQLEGFYGTSQEVSSTHLGAFITFRLVLRRFLGCFRACYLQEVAVLGLKI